MCWFLFSLWCKRPTLTSALANDIWRLYRIILHNTDTVVCNQRNIPLHISLFIFACISMQMQWFLKQDTRISLAQIILLPSSLSCPVIFTEHITCWKQLMGASGEHNAHSWLNNIQPPVMRWTAKFTWHIYSLCVWSFMRSSFFPPSCILFCNYLHASGPDVNLCVL